MEMWLRLAGHGDVGIVAADQAVYRVHSANMSSGYSPEQDLVHRKAAIEHFLKSGAARLTKHPDNLRCGWIANWRSIRSNLPASPSTKERWTSRRAFPNLH